MGMWSILEEGRGYEGFNERGGRELEMAYKEGCEHGYKKGYEAAMREMQGGDMGFRGNNGGSYGGGNYGGGSSGGMNNRYAPGYPPSYYDGTQTQTCQRRVLLIGRGEIPSLFKNIKKQCYEPTIRHL